MIEGSERAGHSSEDEERASTSEGDALSEEMSIDGEVQGLRLTMAGAELVTNARVEWASSESDQQSTSEMRRKIDRDIRLSWSLLDGREKAYNNTPILWDEGMNSCPPRLAKTGDEVPTELPPGWSYDGEDVITPSLNRFMISPTRRLLPQGSPEGIEFVGAKPVGDLKIEWTPAGHMEHDGMHYGEHSAVIPPGQVMDNRDLFSGNLAASDTPIVDYTIVNIALPDAASVPMGDFAPGPVGVDVLMDVRGTYMVEGTDGNRQEVVCQPNIQVAALMNDIVTVHGSMGQAEGKVVDPGARADLTNYLDTSAPLGDTRGLTGLTEVINVVGRGALLGNIRAWFADGARNGDSYLGYTKLWLYVIALMIRDQINDDFAGTVWAFANDPNVLQPAWENSTVDRRCWDAYNAQVRDRSRGWFIADPGTQWQVAQCMADFYRPFPSFTLTMTNHRVNATPAPLGHRFPGIHLVMCTGKDNFGTPPIAAGAGVVPAQQNLPQRAAVPTIAMYHEALRQLAFWRDEVEDCRVGLALALRLSACRIVDEIVPADANTRRWPVWSYGIPGMGLEVVTPITNTLVAAYIKGSVTVMHTFDGVFNIERDWMLRAVHKLAVTGIDATGRVMQALCLAASDVDDMIGNVDTVATDITTSVWGNRRLWKKVFWEGVVQYQRRVFGVHGCREANAVLFNRRQFDDNFRYARIVPAGEVALFVSAWECVFYRHAPRMPWQWEILVAGCSYGGAEVFRSGGQNRRQARFIHTSVSQPKVDRTGKFANVDQYVEALVMTQHASETEGGRPALLFRSRYTESEQVAQLEPRAVILAQAWMADPAHPGTYSRSGWHVNFDSSLLRAVRYEVVRADNANLSRATIETAQRRVVSPGLVLTAALPNADAVHPGALDFPGWDAAPAAVGVGRAGVELAAPRIRGGEAEDGARD